MSVDEVRRAAAPIRSANPRLTVDGWHIERAPYVGRDFDMEQVRAAVLFVRTFGRPRRYFNSKAGSYTLKHYAENWARACADIDVSNGELILAALICGYRHRQVPRTPNCTFDMTVDAKMRRYEQPARSQ
ncbi:hypothetical protein [Caballeronia sp. GAWG1-5s-s]|uniref:hypothetical protein n=1 Tax=Caballeronia sp. GAWG1-5s-s TaxID=2921743 RepID=UPI00202839DD|nr:hypothetical protein [Caballeronia sp. GAWG1-5s-s]